MHGMSNSTQSFQHHTRWVPAFHFVTLPLLLINLVWSLVRVVRHPSADTGMALVVGVALVLLGLFARQFAVAAQDRLIRLEMRLRIRELCPPDLGMRAGEFTPDQLIALRFASDAELPALARKVLDDKVADRKTIKSMVRDWLPDTMRV
jgi:hypothetical protein